MADSAAAASNPPEIPDGSTRPTDDTSRISAEEMIELFGETMPIEAVQLLWSAGDDKTVGELRAELRQIARKRLSADR